MQIYIELFAQKHSVLLTKNYRSETKHQIKVLYYKVEGSRGSRGKVQGRATRICNPTTIFCLFIPSLIV